MEGVIDRRAEVSGGCAEVVGATCSSALVETVEDGLPRRLLRLHHLPVLANRAIPLRCPGNTVPDGNIGFRVRALALENHAPIDQSPVELERAAAVVDPSLVPSLPVAVVEIDAPAA